MSVDWKDPSYFHWMLSTTVTILLFLYITGSWRSNAVCSHNFSSAFMTLTVPEVIIKVTCFFLPHVPCLLTFGSSEASTIAQWAQYSPDNQRRYHSITKSVQTPEVTDSRTSGLRTTCLKCWTITSARWNVF